MIIELDGICRDFIRREGSGLRRTKATKHAVLDMSFAIERGSAVGYIGANGSGKSTTIKMMTGILAPTSGHIRVCGLNPVPQRKQLARHIGVVFGQRSQLWWDLPLQESYPLLAAIHRRPDAAWRARYDDLVDGLDMHDFLSTPVRNLSLGQRMRGELAAALIHEPELIVLDEPTIGLDMISKEQLRAFLNRERAERGTTLVLTTHDMGDVQRLCERMLIIDHGQLVFDGDEGSLQTETHAERVLTLDLTEPVPTPALPVGCRIVSNEGIQLRIAFAPSAIGAADVLAAISAQALVTDMSLAEPDIEDLVKQIYQRS